ncbi:MAG: PAS domain S-box protein, partial [Candidatus Edwardsbacteria bacterium]|nr:PAS domain S-box protein [Candidatus Edwardsbacteria bacterium]
LAPLECRIRHADGSWRTLEHIAQNLIADPVINGVIVNSRDITERRQSDALKNALYKISELTTAARNLREFYAGVHRIVAELMYARNFYICLYDQAEQQLTYPYYVDEFDLPPQSRRMGRGLTDYIIRFNQPLLAFREHLKKLMDGSEIEIHGGLPAALLAVPLVTSTATIGALVVQSYTDSLFFAERDKEILTYVSQQVAAALERKQAQEALRNSESNLRAVFNNSNQAFILIDVNQKVQIFNTKAADWSRTFCGRELREYDIIYYYLAPEQIDDFTLYIEGAKKGRPFTAELLFRQAGRPHWFETGFNPVYDDDGQIYGVCMTLMNIDDRRRAVEDLARSEERFRAMVQNSSDNIIVINAAGAITYQSPSVERVLGYKPAALLGTNAFDLIHPEDRPRVMDAVLANLDRPGVIKQIEYRAKHADGSWVYLESVGNNLLHDPVIGGIVINTRDVTERRQSDVLKNALYRIEEITNTAGDLPEFFAAVHRVIEKLIDTPNFYIALYDPETQMVSFPYFIDEMDSPPPPRTLADGLTDHIIRTGQTLFIKPEYMTQLEREYDVKEIGTPCLDWLGVPLKTGDRIKGAIVVQSYRGNLRYGERAKEILTFVSHNIAAALERRQNQESLMRQGLAIENMDESVVITGRDGTIQYVNPAFTAVSGYDRGEVIGRNPRFWKSGRHDAAFYRELWGQLLQGRTWQGSLINKKRDGSPYEEEVTISPVKNRDGETINYVAIKRDVTEKRRLQSIAEAANTMNNIGYVFSGIRHEIGNALNSMKMATSIVQKNLDGWSKESLKKFIDMAMSEVGRMEDLLRSLKNFSMYEAPKLQELDLPDFFKKLVMLAAGDFKSRGIPIRLAVEPDIGRAVADPRALHQVLLNLLSNAADALEGREAKRIDIKVSRDSGLVRIAIRDNGCGMSPEQLANLFKPFYTSKPEGTGLGLVITRNILVKMNSTIEVESQLERGTEVVVAIPETEAGPAGA